VRLSTAAPPRRKAVAPNGLGGVAPAEGGVARVAFVLLGSPRGGRSARGLLEDPMKLIKTIVRPDKVDAVKDSLGAVGVSGMTVTEVRGHGKQKGHTAIYRGQEYNVSLLPKMEIELVVADAAVDDAVKAIIAAARTGEIGDGRVFVTPVEQSYRIRTGEFEQG
jgi:nitrogen regulatory protein PII